MEGYSKLCSQASQFLPLSGSGSRKARRSSRKKKDEEKKKKTGPLNKVTETKSKLSRKSLGEPAIKPRRGSVNEGSEALPLESSGKRSIKVVDTTEDDVVENIVKVDVSIVITSEEK